MASRARVGKARGTAKAAPARSRVQAQAETASVALEIEAPAVTHSSPSGRGRKLPIRSSPVSTTRSLRSSLSALEKPRAPKAKAQAPVAELPPFSPKVLLQELEPRLLMSADLNPFAGDALLATPATQPAEFRALTEQSKPSVVTSAALAPVQRSSELVFVDTATPDYESLVEAMRSAANTAGLNVEFVLIDSDRDGVQKITETLAEKKDLDAIHVISHARDGAVQLGSAQLDFETLVKQAAQIKAWGNALGEDGDILFYGCDLAATQEGKSLLEALSRLTGADVAASEDKTGSATQGGDWQLEFRTGAIDGMVLVSVPAQVEWNHVLPISTFQEGVSGYTGTQDTHVRGAATTTSYGTAIEVTVDSDDGGAPMQGLIRFDSIFGGGAGQIPLGSTITSVELVLETLEQGNAGNTYSIYRIQPGVSWSEASTWNSLTGGLNSGTDYLAAADTSRTGIPTGTTTFTSTAGLVATVQAWSDGAVNNGWALIQSGGADEWGFASSENGTSANRPELRVTWNAPATYSVSGTLHNDVDGDGTVGEAGEGVFANATTAVRLYLDNGDGTPGAGDTLQGVAVGTDASGNYSFTGVANGTYWVAVDSRRLDAGTYNGGNTLNNVWAEQTYANANATDKQAVFINAGYQFDTTAGAFFGGMENSGASSSDDASALATAEHVHRVTVAGANITAVDTGFSFSAITTNRDGDDDAGNASRSIQGSLRQFLQNSNAIAANLTAQFEIGAPGTSWTIALTSALPTITDTVFLDAWTQGAAGYNGPPLIVLDGNDVAGSGVTLSGTADGSTVRGLVIRDFGVHGIQIQAGSDNNLIVGNYIGRLNADGTPALAGEENTADGIRIDGANNNTIGGTTAAARNIVSGNVNDGFNIRNTATGNVIQGNWIGQDGAGNALGNADGLEIQAGSINNWVGGIGVGTGNVIRGNLDSGVELRDLTTDGNRILGNSIFGNGALGIDLEGPDNAVGDPDTGPNQGQNYPVISSVTNVGSALRVQGTLSTTAAVGTYRIEFFLSAAGDPEGQTFLGAVDVTTNGAGNASFDATFGVAVIAGQLVTTTATDSAGNTSQFSTAFAAPAVGGGGNTISGTVYEDRNGDASLADAVGAAGVTVRLFQDGDNDGVIDVIGTDPLVQTAFTGATGDYTFMGLTAGTRYWVVVDSKTINPSNIYNAGSGIGNVWAEQTFARGDAASGAGFVTVNGAHYSGRNAAQSDDGAAANTAEHVNRVVAAAGAVSNVNFGFSFNAVTNTLAGDNADHDGAGTARTVQGSLRQFIQNANAIAGAATMRFVPAAAPNVQTGGYIDDANYTNDGGNDWWQIVVTTALPAITTQTTIDGTAYSRFDGISLANTNQGVLGFVGAVGLGADGIAGTGDDPAPLAGVELPDLEIIEGGAAQVAVGLDLQANNITVRAISIHGFGNDDTATGSLEDQGDIRIGVDAGGDTGSTFSASGILIENSVIGVGPSSLADPGVNNRSLNGILVAGPDGGTIQNNIIASAGQFGIFLTDNADGWIVTGNDIRQNGREDSGRDGIDIGNLSGGATVTRNYFFQNAGSGIDSWRGDGGNTIRDNTLDGNGTGATETAGMRIFGTGSAISQNVIQNGAGAGVLIVRQEAGVTNTPATGNLISKNSFSNNARIAIDLNDDAPAGNQNIGDGITFNDAGATPANAGNTGIDYPVILNARKIGTTTTISGTAAAGVTSVEVYRAASGAGDDEGIIFWDEFYGEGAQYLGTAAVAAGAWTLNFVDGAITLNPGEHVTAIGITAANNTSEFSRVMAVTPTVNVVQTATPITIDGTIDAAWAGAVTSTSGLVVPGTGTISGPADLSATWRTLWDATNLYVLVEVNDSEVKNPDSGANFADDDVVELFVDGNYSRTTAWDGNDYYDGVNDYQWMFRRNSVAPNGGDLTTGAFSVASTAGINFRMVAVAGGYRLEALIPWTTIGNVPFVGDNVGIEVQVGDDDSPDTLRDSKLTWGDAVDYSFLDAGRFGTGVLVPAAGSTISGTLWHDVDADADVSIPDGTLTFASITNAVKLFSDGGVLGTPEAGDAQVGVAVNTDASGVFTFSNVADGTYWVVVDSRTLNANANTWAEQTYGDDSTTAGLPDLDARYGGRSATVSDVATNAGNAEHVARVTVSGGNVTGVDFGFSFNVVTNMLAGDNTDHDGSNPRTVQGSFRQFLQNANANAAPTAAMRFVPLGNPNQVTGGSPTDGDDWWRLNVTTVLPTITRANTVIDGTAYVAAINGAVRDTNTGTLGVGGFVGVDNLALSLVQRPELELVGNKSFIGLTVNADDVTIQDIGLHAFTYGVDVLNVDRTTLQGSVIGARANGTDPGAAGRIDNQGIRVRDGDDGIVQNNYFAFIERAGITLQANGADGADGWDILNNEIRGNDFDAFGADGISVDADTDGTLIRGNLVTNNLGPGIDFWQADNNNIVENNTITNNLSPVDEIFGIRFDQAGTGNVIDRNIISANNGPGVLIRGNSSRVTITQNSIFGNIDTDGGGSVSGIGIDLDTSGVLPADGNGVTPNDISGTPPVPQHDADTGPNALQNFPVLSVATINGADVTITGTIQSAPSQQYRIEFFATAAPDVNGNIEGQRYLGAANVTTDANGNFTFSQLLTPAVPVALNEYITATATRSNLGFASLFETSEFSAAIQATYAISGTIYEDINGDANLGDAVGSTGVTVRLFRDNNASGTPNVGDGAAVATAITNAAGFYQFNVGQTGTYWVVVDSRSITPSIGTSIANQVWAEQTYGVVGALTPTGPLATAGAAYGGRSAATSDNSTGLDASLATSDHITRAIIAASSVTGVDSAFSFNVVTNVRGDGVDDAGGVARLQQGSLHQFILNANAMNGPNAMVFVPAVNANVDGGDGLGVGGNDYWRVSVTSVLPQINGAAAANTTIDGTAFGFTYGVAGISVRDDNIGTLGTGGFVGVDNIALTTVNRPELEIADGVALPGAPIATGLDVQANNVTIRDLAIWGFGRILPSDIDTGDIHVGTVTSTLIEGNVIGTTAASFTDPGAEYSIGYGISVRQGDGGTIRGNLIGWHGDSGVLLADFATGWLVESNEIRRSGLVNQLGDGIDADQDANNETVRWNLIADNRSPAIDFWQRAANANIVNNTMTGNDTGVVSDIFTIGFTNPGLNNVVDRNVISGGTGPGVMVRENVGGAPVAGGYVRITQNSIYGNIDPAGPISGLGIDLAHDGVTANDGAGDGDTGPNALQNFPTATSFSTDGVDLTVSNLTIPGPGANTYRIELFASAAADPSGNGEGTRYLGSWDMAGGTTFNGTFAGFNVAAGEYVTMTATRTNALVPTLFFETSEFSAAYQAAGVADISGTIYEDVNGDSQSGDFVGRDGVVVRLFRDTAGGGAGTPDGTDTFVTSTVTGPGGTYTFANQVVGTYWVVVDSRTITPNIGTSIANQVWAEQTYGVAGALNPAGVLATDGALFGGRSAATSDASTNAAASLLTSDHITRVAMSGTDVTGVNSAFSFNVVTDVRGGNADEEGVGANPRLQQGTLRQFILNANAMNGANAMVFVPAVNPNQITGVLGGGDDWWRITVTGAALPQITGAAAANTTIDGTAFGFTYGVAGISVRDDNIGLLGTGGNVGVDNVALGQVERPELEITDGAAPGVIDFGLDIRAPNATIRDLSIWGFGDAAIWGASGNISIQGDANDNAVIEGNVIGTGPASFSAPGSPGEGAGIYIDAADGGTVQGNLIGYVGFAGINLYGGSNNWTIEQNEIRGIGQLDPNHWFDGINVGNPLSVIAIRENLIAANLSPGVDFGVTTSGATVENNTITGNGILGDSEQFGIDFANPGVGNVVDRNIITDNRGAGILVTDPAGTGVVRITQNSIYGNIADAVGPNLSSGLGIDLNRLGTANGDGVTANDQAGFPYDTDTGPNALQNWPVLSSASSTGATVTVSGSLRSTANTNFRIEFFASPAADALGNGEGQLYIGSIDVNTGATGVANFTTPAFGVAVTPGWVITATATRTDALVPTQFFETSEFSNAVGTATIAGTIFHDVNADATVLPAEGVFANLASTAVKLYRDDGDFTIDAGDALITTTGTDALGNYTFGSLATGTYWVVVDSKLLAAPGYNLGFDIDDVWAEQTFAAYGAILGPGPVATGAPGALYGGREAIVGRSDDASTLATAEHIIGRTLAGVDATQVDFGFSFNAVVNTRGDTTDNDGTRPGLQQQGTLRQFILNSNAISGIQTSNFSINYAGGGGAQTITLLDPDGAAPGGPLTGQLPAITDAAILDATTQEGFSLVTRAPIIELRGDQASLPTGGAGFADGIIIQSTGASTVRGFVINRFDNDGIYINGGSGHIIQGNWIGTDLTGNAAAGNRNDGIDVENATNVTIGGAGAGERNVISGNLDDGIEIKVTSIGTKVRSNYIGVGADGLTAVGNGSDGLEINGSTNTIGGSLAGEGNVIASSTENGIRLVSTGSGNVVLGNIIGLAADGDTVRGNVEAGIRAAGANSTIGGIGAFERNVISGNLQQGIYLPATGNVVIGNYIGTDVNGTADRGNSQAGILLDGGDSNTIGGSTGAERNIIAGNNSDGISLWTDADFNVIRGNWIGQGAGGAALGNTDDGIEITGGSNDNWIGGTGATDGNVIRASTNEGIEVRTNGADGNRILGNSIYGNTVLGIDLAGVIAGPDVNDPGDPDTITNQGQNYPVIGTVINTGASLRVIGTLSTTPAVATYRVEFFVSAGTTEGRTYLGFKDVTTTGAGLGTFDEIFAIVPVVGEFVTMTATDAAGNTSEFSAAVAVPVVGNFTVSGTIFEDVAADGSIAADPGRDGVSVRLYRDTAGGGAGSPDATDSYIGTAVTAGGGLYSFTGLNNGTYWVVVDSRTFGATGYNGAGFVDDVWADQTYGVAGAMNGAASFLAADGALFGGRAAGTSDNPFDAAVPNSAINAPEHVTRVIVAGGNELNNDFGFSFNPVVNTRGDNANDDVVAGTDRLQQGTLRQFILNANAISGANGMRFVPAVGTNDSGSGGNWWTINVASVLPTISDANTTIDGTAYSSADGVTIVNPNAGQVGTGGTVGVDGLALSQVDRPELELAGGNAFTGPGLRVAAGDATIRDIAINGFGATMDSAQIQVDATVVGLADQAVITGNLIGTNADGTNPGAGTTENIGILTNGATSITNNYIAYIENNALMLSLAWLGTPNTQPVSVTNNEIAFNQFMAGFTGDMVSDVPSNAVITGNYIHDFQGAVTLDVRQGKGIEVWYQTQNALIENNTITGMRIAGIGINDGSNGNTIRKNIVTGTTGVAGSGGAGILITSFNDTAAAPPTGNTITQNSVYGNFGLGIDLDARGPAFSATYVGDGVTANDAADADAGANRLQNFPVIDVAAVSGGTVTISGHFDNTDGSRTRANSTYTIDFYANFAAASGREGRTYLGSATVTTDASGDGTFTSLPLAFTGYALGDRVTATATMTSSTGGFGAEIGSTSEFSASVVTTPANAAPVITSDGGGAAAALNVAENSTAVTDVDATDPDVPSTLTYTILGGADALLFSIVPATGVLSFNLAPDFEAPTDAGADNVYDVIVQVADGLGGFDTQAIAVTVTNVNEPPVISSDGGGAAAALNVAENSTAVTTVTSSDVDGAAPSYSIIGGADALLFSIVPATGVLSFNLAPDFETPTDAGANNVYDVIVQVADGLGGFDTQAIAVSVTNVNEPPVISSDGGGAAAALNVAENSTAVTDVDATDPDVPSTLTYTILGGADALLFSIVPATGVLSFNLAPDFEAPTDAGADNVYDVIVQVADGLGGFDTQAIAVTVTNVNEPPVISSDGGGAAAALNVAENSTAVTTVTSSDVDGAAPSYSIIGGADALLFSIVPATGVLSFNLAPDFETPTDAGANNVYDVIVQVADGLGGFDTQAIAVSVTNVNEPPVISSDGGGAAAALNVAENSTAVTDVDATDPDVPSTLTYTILGGADALLFSIVPATGVLSFNLAPDFEAPTDAGADNVYDVIVQVADGLGGFDTQAIAVTVTNVNEPPVISSDGGGAAAALNVAENSTAVTTVTSSDVDGAAPSYSIIGGADALLFSIVPATGVLSFNLAPDFETPTDAGANNVYDVIVQVADGLGGFDTQAIAVSVTNVNEPPVISSDGGGAAAALNVAENSTAVTDVDATDPDVPSTLTYTILGGADALLFSIVPATGVLSFNLAPDFEAPTDAGADNVYDVIVQVADGLGGFDTQAIAVTVTNVNEPPVISSDGGGAAAALNVAENSTAVTTVTSSDVDGAAPSYSIIGGADALLFSIVPATGVLSFNLAPDFETPTDAGANNVYDVIVQVADGLGGFDTQAIAVSVTNVNEPPVISSDGGGAAAALNVAENSTAVTDVDATDPDVPSTLTYTILGGADALLFSIVPATGVLSFNLAPDFEAPTDAGADNVYDVIVQVADGLGGFDTQAIAVTVTNVNEPPVISSDGGGAAAALNVAENSTAVTTVTSSDVDGAAPSYSIIGGADALLFSIVPATGVLSFNLAPDFETPTDAGANNVYDVIVQVADGLGGFDTQAIAVSVTNVNEPPVISSDGGGAAAALNVAENSTAVTDVDATDPDVPSTLTYTILGGADALLFSIVPATGVLSFNLAPDFEAPTDAGADNVYDVIVQVADGLGGFDTQAIAVTVTNVNEPPVISSDGGGAAAALNVAENSTAVTTVTSSDVDGAAPSYSIIGGADALLFSIVPATGVLSFNLAPDFETPTDAGANNVYDVIVQVADGLGGFDTQAIAVSVTNVNEPPVISSDGGGAAAALNVAENSTAVTDVDATDPDVPSTLTYTILGGADALLFSIVPATGVLSFNLAPDFEAPTDAGADNVYDVIVQVADGLGGFDTQAIAVTVTNVNEPPVISSDGGGAAAALNVAENSTAVTTVTSSDVDGAAPSYSIIGGADALLFSIVPATGVLSFNLAPDFETPTDAGANNVYDVIVQVADGLGGFDTQAIAVSVTNVNELPVNTLPLGPLAAAEDTALALGGISIADPDGGTIDVSLSVVNGTLTVSLAGGATISGGANGSGALTLSGSLAQVNAALTTLGYQGNLNYFGPDALTMSSTDPGALNDTDNVAIAVTPVNDAPVPGNNTFTINDGGTLGIASGNLSATDIDNPIGTLVFDVSGMTHGHFELVSGPGVAIATFTQQQILNGEVRFVHDGSNVAPTFSIQVTDGAAGVGPYAANIVFNGSGITPPPPPPGGGGGGGGSTTVTPPVTSTPPPPPLGVPGGGGQGGLRSPTGLGDGGEEDIGVIVAQSAPGAALAKLLVAEAQTLPIRAQAEVLETTPARTEIAIEPIRAEMQVLPTSHEFAQDDEEKQRIEIIMNSVRITGLALSVGAVWWAARAAGLIASLLASAPAWRHMDPLPVLGRDEEDEEESYEGEEDEKERERKDDEHRASWVLDEPSTAGER